MAIRSMERGSIQKRRINIAFLFILACYLALMARLLYLQGLHGAEIREQASRQRLQTIVKSARRGSIYDRDGALLATSLYSGEVGFDPAVACVDGKDPKTRRKIEEQLARSIPLVAGVLQMPRADLEAIIDKARADYHAALAANALPGQPAARRPIRFVRLKRGVSLETAQTIRDTRPRLMGFGVLDDSTRAYASGASAAHVVGFLGSAAKKPVGRAGLERSCEPWLRGDDGRAVAELDDHKREIADTLQMLKPVRDGYDVHTTLDADAQHIATLEAQKIVAQYHPKGVSVVVLDPNKGDILALVSVPNFDPNPEQRALLGQLPRAELPEHFRDRCTASLYEPGSTLKALTIAAALDKNIVSLNSGFYCSGELHVNKKTIHCAHGEVHGDEGLADILRHSCNVGAAEIGMRMTARKLYTADQQFGLLDKLDLNLPGLPSGRWSFDKNEKQFTEAKAARVAFGHSIATTPLHVALAYGALANGGTLMKPRLITSLTDSRGRIIRQWDAQSVRRVISTQTSAHLTTMLRGVVSNGTAKAIAMPGYQIAGKTGTAKKYAPGKYVGSFVGYLPAGPNVKPRVVILVAVDEPQGDKYYGGEVAAPAFAAIASHLMQQWHIPEDDPEGSQARMAQYNLKHPEKLHIRIARR